MSIPVGRSIQHTSQINSTHWHVNLTWHAQIGKSTNYSGWFVVDTLWQKLVYTMYQPFGQIIKIGCGTYYVQNNTPTNSILTMMLNKFMPIFSWLKAPTWAHLHQRDSIIHAPIGLHDMRKMVVISKRAIQFCGILQNHITICNRLLCQLQKLQSTCLSTTHCN